MMVTTVRCDYCHHLLTQGDTSAGTVIDSNVACIRVEWLRVRNGPIIGPAEFCSADCLANAVRERMDQEASKEQVFRALAEQLGYEITKRPGTGREDDTTDGGATG